ncbi:MAG: ECF transporter S component [Clostridiaceae bacterium]|nr:ECF transporter S component [Clostridiaceae bacterium]
MKNVSRSTNLMVKIALLATLGLLLSFVQFPILPAFSYLQIDLGDIPALIGAFAFGPIIGIAVEAVKNLIILIFHPSPTGGIGELANFIVGAAFVGTAGLFYSKNKTKKTAIISLVVSVIAIVIAGVVSNYLLIVPLYFGKMPTDKLVEYMVSGIIPFNLIKGVIISVVTMLIYKSVSPLIHSESLNNKFLRNNKKSV